MIGLGSKYRHELIVNTRDGQAFRGIYWGAPGQVLRLRQARMLEPDGPVPMDGEVVIFKSQILFIQKLLTE